MTTIDRLNKLTNQITKESEKDWDKINHSKIEKWEDQSAKCAEMIMKSPKLQAEYEEINGCEFDW